MDFNAELHADSALKSDFILPPINWFYHSAFMYGMCLMRPVIDCSVTWTMDVKEWREHRSSEWVVLLF